MSSSRERPILLVGRHDGIWPVLCGGAGHETEEALTAHLGHLLDQDPTLIEVSDLREMETVERTAVGEPWVRATLPPDLG